MRLALATLAVLILLTRIAHAQELSASEGGVIFANVADYMSTRSCVDTQRCREVNIALLRIAPNKPALVATKAIGTFTMLWLTRRIARDNPKLANITNWALTGFFGAVTVNNILQTRKARR